MKLNKPYTNTQYADLAVYCNKNGMLIEDKGDYLEAVNPPEPTLEEAKTSKHSELKSTMQTKRQVLKVDYDNDQFDANETAQANMNTLLQAFNLGAKEVSIRSATEKTHSFNQTRCNELALLMVSAVNNLYGEYWALKDKLDICTSKEEVEAIVWN